MPLRTLALLALLYFAQGLPFGFQATALPIYLRVRGASLTSIGWLGLLSLPWMLKALWAPWVDRYGSVRFGRRKSWIVPLQVGLAAAAATAGAMSARGEIVPVLALVGLMNLFAATQDIAVDGWAVELLRGRALGPGNAAQVVGYKLGMLTGGGLLVWASGSWGWSGLFYTIAVLCLSVGAVAWATPERSAPEAAGRARQSLTDIFRTLGRTLRAPGAGWVLALIATYKVGESMADAMFKPFLVDTGIRPAQIGLWLGTYGMAASLAGSVVGGWAAARWGSLRAVGVTGALRCLPLLAQTGLALVPASTAAIVATTCAEHFFGGLLTTAMFAWMMSRV
ncbi:MAG TPA: MFS transporter, partial [Myxococcaceae bacterium]|nr:MFS transporter [Myxococcaceae bacterium]